jgi:hypothetical protein
MTGVGLLYPNDLQGGLAIDQPLHNAPSVYVASSITQPAPNPGYAPIAGKRSTVSPWHRSGLLRH